VIWKYYNYCVYGGKRKELLNIYDSGEQGDHRINQLIKVKNKLKNIYIPKNEHDKISLLFSKL